MSAHYSCPTSRVRSLLVLFHRSPGCFVAAALAIFSSNSLLSSFLTFSSEFSLQLFHPSLISYQMFPSDLLLSSCSVSLFVHLFILHICWSPPWPLSSAETFRPVKCTGFGISWTQDRCQFYCFSGCVFGDKLFCSLSLGILILGDKLPSF